MDAVSRSAHFQTGIDLIDMAMTVSNEYTQFLRKGWGYSFLNATVGSVRAIVSSNYSFFKESTGLEVEMRQVLRTTTMRMIRSTVNVPARK